MDWKQYFEMMKDWKQLPAYRAEPRIDSFIGFYLPEILTDYYCDKIRGIIPELPIRLGTVKPRYENKNFADRSYKVDFYLLGDSGNHYFVEFKTDSGSRREKQDEYLKEVELMGMREIVAGIARIASVSSYKKKYNHLISKMVDLGLMNSDRQFVHNSNKIQIVYVQPHKKDNDTAEVIEFEWISQWLVQKIGDNDFGRQFADALMHWAKD